MEEKDIFYTEIRSEYRDIRTTSGRTIPLTSIKPGVKLYFTKNGFPENLNPQMITDEPLRGETRTVIKIIPPRTVALSNSYVVLSPNEHSPRKCDYEITHLAGLVELVDN